MTGLLEHGLAKRCARVIPFQRVRLLGATAALTLLAGCHMDMWVQPKVVPYQPSEFYTDGQSMRPPVAHTVDRTHFWTDSGRYTGYEGRKMIDTIPIKLGRQDVMRGQERFNIFCSPCHGALGNGMGMIAMRGLSARRQPASYHTDRLRKMPIGHFYDVITNGYGVMYSYASRIEPDDRWRIAAYVRILQRSQNAKLTDIPEDKRSGFTEPPPAAASPTLPAGAPSPAQNTTAPGSMGNPEAPGQRTGTSIPGVATPSNLVPNRAYSAPNNVEKSQSGGTNQLGSTGTSAPQTPPPGGKP